MNEMSIIAVTNLNVLSAAQLLLKPGKHTLLYYQRSIPGFVLTALKKRYSIKPCNLDEFPVYFISNEKKILSVSTRISNHAVMLSLIESMSKILGINARHVQSAVTKRIVKAIRADIGFLHILENKYKDRDDIECWLVNARMLGRFSRMNLAKSINTYQIQWFNILRACYLSVWPLIILLFWFNRMHKRKPLKRYKMVFQQRYSMRYGGNPDFEAFYRYLKKRDDVGYHCRNKNDEIYKSLLREGKPVFSTRELSLNLFEGARFYRVLTKLVMLFLGRRNRFVQKATLWCMIFSIFREYVAIKSVLLNCPAEYVMRVRGEEYENHPIATGVCDVFGSKHIGYRHAPPVFFDANFALTDFHRLGVVGKTDNTVIYKCRRKIEPWSVIGPIGADICYDMSVPKSQKKIIAFFATTPVFDVNDTLFKTAFSHTIDFIKDKPGIKLIYREKCNLYNRMTFIKEKCRPHDIDMEIEYWTQSGRHMSGYSSYTIKRADMMIIASHSTTAWECLSLKKKLMVIPDSWNRHPLEDFQPNLTARDGEQFREKIDWLWNIPYPDYIKLVQPIIDTISREANGRMVESFFTDFVGIDNPKAPGLEAPWIH